MLVDVQLEIPEVYEDADFVHVSPSLDTIQGTRGVSPGVVIAGGIGSGRYPYRYHPRALMT